MKGFIFAAGFGERLHPLTERVAKSLMPVLNIPCICYSVFLLKEAGIMDIVCNLHYRYREIIEFFEKHEFFGMNIRFSVEKEILGTGGGLKKCEGMIGDSEFVVINSDIISDINLREVIEHHRASSSPATIVLKEDDTESGGTVSGGTVSVSLDEVEDFRNFLGSGLVRNFDYTGIAVLSPVLFEYLTEQFSSIVYTGYVDLIKYHSLDYFEHRGFWQDIGNINSLWNVNISGMNEITGLRERMYPLLDLSPEIISLESIIDKSAAVRNSVIGEKAVIGENALVEDSLIMPGSVVDDNAIIKKSIVSGNDIFRIDE